MHAPMPSTSRLSLSPDGAIEGYASLFGEIDQSRDMVMPGAFTQTLTSRGVRRVPMLFQHDPAEPVGIWLELREDFRGLFARGRLIPDVARGRELLALLRNGAIDGLSIGYRTVRGRIDPKTRIRALHQVDLWEISIVTFPLLDGARVRAVKDAPVSRSRATAERDWQAAMTGSFEADPRKPAPLLRTVAVLKQRAGRKAAQTCAVAAHGRGAQAARRPQGGAARPRGRPRMTSQQSDYAAALQARWLRCDAHRWVKPDAAKFYKPGTDLCEVFPALARQRDRKRRDADRAFADGLEYERALFDKLCRELTEVNAELALRRAGRAAEEKYSPSQPRVPGGHGRASGRWTSGDDGSGARPRVVIDTTTFGDDASGDEGAGGDSSYDGADSNPGFDDPGDS